MLKRSSQVSGARVLVMALTLKGKCPDLRKTRAVEVICDLQDSGIIVYMHHPRVDAEEMQEDYGLEKLAQRQPGDFYL